MYKFAKTDPLDPKLREPARPSLELGRPDSPMEENL